MKTSLSFILYLIFSASLLAQQLDFAQALELTLRNNYGINISRNNLQQAENNNTAGNAGMLPTLDAQGQADVSSRNTDITFFDGSSISRPNAQSQNLSALAALEWTVFDGFRMFARRSELRAAEDLAENQLRAQIEIASLDLARIFYQLILEEKLVAVYRNNLAISQSRLKIIKNSREVGSASGLDVDQSLIDVANDSITLLQQVNHIQNLKNDLWLVLGDTTQTSYSVGETIAIDSTLKYEPLRDSLHKLNSDLLSARSQAEISKSLVDQARARMYPEVSLFGNYGYTFAQNEAGQVQQLRSFGPSVGIRVEFNLFNGFNDQRQLRNRQLDSETARLNVAQTQLQASNSLQKSFNNYRFYLQVLKLRNQNIERARKTVDVGLKQLELGVINNVDFRTLQLTYLQTETDRLSALYNAKLSELQLLVLSGQFSVDLR